MDLIYTISRGLKSLDQNKKKDKKVV